MLATRLSELRGWLADEGGKNKALPTKFVTVGKPVQHKTHCLPMPLCPHATQKPKAPANLSTLNPFCCTAAAKQKALSATQPEPLAYITMREKKFRLHGNLE